MDPRLPIRNLDYAVVFARQMAPMCEFYEKTLGFAFHRKLGPKWVEFRVGSSIVAIAEPGGLFDDPVPPVGVLSLQLAFRVAPAEVELCAATLERGVELIGPHRSAVRSSHAVLPRSRRQRDRDIRGDLARAAMFDHVKFGVSDYAASKAFFLKALEPLGLSVVSEGSPAYGVELAGKGKASLCLWRPRRNRRIFTWRSPPRTGGKSRRSIGRQSRREARTTVRLVCARIPRELLCSLRYRSGWAQRRGGVPRTRSLFGNLNAPDAPGDVNRAIHEEVKLVPYDPAWQSRFAVERQRLVAQLSGVARGRAFRQHCHPRHAFQAHHRHPGRRRIHGCGGLALRRRSRLRLHDLSSNAMLPDRRWFMRSAGGLYAPSASHDVRYRGLEASYFLP